MHSWLDIEKLYESVRDFFPRIRNIYIINLLVQLFFVHKYLDQSDLSTWNDHFKKIYLAIPRNNQHLLQLLHIINI